MGGARSRPAGAASRRSHLETLFGRGCRGPSAEWQQRVHVCHGSPGRLGTLTDVEDLADFRRWIHKGALDVTATVCSGTRSRKLRVDAVQAAELYFVGATLTF